MSRPQPSTSDLPANRPEITVRVLVLGVVLSVVMGAANVYVGLKAGMTVSASIPAAVMAMLVFRFLFRQSSILEANQVQTCASAGESLAAGIIFTMPALLLIGYWTEFDTPTVAAIAFTGGLLGILFMIPMRKVFVTDNPDLPYPEGIACAAVLEAGEAAGADTVGPDDVDAARRLIAGGMLGLVFKVLEGSLGVVRATVEGAASVGKGALYLGADISPMLVAVGFIVRLNVALLIAIGGAIGWLVAIPLMGGVTEGASALDVAWDQWDTQVRYLGVGAMVVGGLASIVTVRHGLVAAVRELRAGLTSGATEDRHRDLSSRLVLGLGVLSIALIAGIYYHFTGHVGTTVLTTIVMVIAAFFFTAVASYIVGLVGNSNSPVSGMTITAVLFAGGMLLLFGYTGMEGMVACLGVAAVVCCVACTSGDVCNDLKTGELVGAAPFRQQGMQILGVAVASLVMAPVLNLLNDQYTIGSRELSAPQAGLFASLAEGLFGDGDLPWDMVQYGAVLGLVILGLDALLKSSGKKFRLHLMPVAVGIYLPFGLALPILAGGVLAHMVTRGARDDAEVEARVHPGVLFSSGVIAGEALTSVGLAIVASLGLSQLDLGLSEGATLWTSLGAAALALVLFSRFVRPR